jgi:DNA primase
MSTEQLVTLIQTHANLVQIASAYIPLRESRRIFKGPCPFHSDQTNSLMISPEKNQFKCFGCGIDGGPLEFVMKVKGITLQEALTSLASTVNIA